MGHVKKQGGAGSGGTCKKAGWGRIRWDREGQGKMEQGKAGWGRMRWDREGQGEVGQERAS